ncbi:MAG: tetratricopeptide repeat protein [Pirellulales bacterium]|nr:tetratricopeptide repeat protein [Pirellulales bacterium]
MVNSKYLQKLKQLAKEAFHAGLKPVVVELLSPYLTQQTEDGYAWFIYGDSLRIIGRNSEALVALKNALDLAPADRLPDVHILLGITCEDSGRQEEAEHWYAMAAECNVDPERGWLWIFRGVNFARMEQFEEAAQCYLHAIELDYNKDEAYLNLGYVLRAQGKYSEAAEALEKALSLTPDYPEAREVLDSLGGIQEAVAFTHQGRTE